MPLTQAALAIVAGLPEAGWLFTTNGKQAIGSLSRHKAAIDKASGVECWTLHDLPPNREVADVPRWRPHRPMPSVASAMSSAASEASTTGTIILRRSGGHLRPLLRKSSG